MPRKQREGQKMMQVIVPEEAQAAIVEEAERQSKPGQVVSAADVIRQALADYFSARGIVDLDFGGGWGGRRERKH
ncbi:MAG: hypothetical protein JNJ61_25760 [Anaerolineae bacterium]|nr:hypothetical protein [Anaerolineae bacterium]